MSCVLVVDDDQTFQETCESTLRDEGHEVIRADSASEALNALAEHLPDAMLLDWRLRDSTGLTVLEWMRSANLRVPTALITGFWGDLDFPRAVTEARRLGARECLRRSIDLEDPGEIVRRLLDPICALHDSIVRGDPIAADAIAEHIARRLISPLRARFRKAQREMIADAVTDATVEYLRAPERFDATRGVPLERFLYIAAVRNLANATRSERRHHDREVAYSAAVLPTDRLTTSFSNSLIEKALDREPDPGVRRALRQWLDGDRRIELWMRLRGFQDLPVGEVKRAVKRIKDAFVARCKRTSS